jgi:hypothetical protein
MRDASTLDPRPHLRSGPDGAVRIPWGHDIHLSRPTHFPARTILDADGYGVSRGALARFWQGEGGPWTATPPLVWVRETAVWTGARLVYQAETGLPSVLDAPRRAWSPRIYTAHDMPRRFARLWLIRGEDGRYRRWEAP